MDDIDRRILAALQSNCRQSMAEVADKAGLSPSASHRRIGLLEESGVISGYVAVLSPEKLGFEIEFYVEISLNEQTDEALSAFEAAVVRVPEVLECHLMTGAADYFLRVAVRSIADYERIHREWLGRLPHVARVETSLRLRTVKPWRGLPLSR